jgi:hypothetical protein
MPHPSTLKQDRQRLFGTHAALAYLIEALKHIFGASSAPCALKLLHQDITRGANGEYLTSNIPLVYLGISM